jgi:hypothetical protein
MRLTPAPRSTRVRWPVNNSTMLDETGQAEHLPVRNLFRRV